MALHSYRLALFLYAYLHVVDVFFVVFVVVSTCYAITANGVCLHLLVPLFAQWCT